MGAQTPFEVTRWRRYGKDRLYVRDSSGVEVGWWDLVAEQAHPAAPKQEPMLIDAVRRWLGDADADGDRAGTGRNRHRDRG